MHSADGTLLAGGIRVVPGYPLFAEVRGARPEMPPGEMLILDPRRLPQMPTLEGLGEAPFEIGYVTAAEIAAFSAAPAAFGSGGGGDSVPEGPSSGF